MDKTGSRSSLKLFINASGVTAASLDFMHGNEVILKKSGC